MTGDSPPRVLVVGAGFGGLAAVAALARSGLQVTLSDRNAYSTFQPLLYQVATAGLAPSDVAYPARVFARAHGARFRRGELTGIDTAGHRVTFADGSQAGYDYLVLATGVSAAYYGVTGAPGHSHGLYTLRDARILRDHIMAGLEQLSTGDRQGHKTVTIVGGGATGTELAGTLADLRNLGLATAYPRVEPSHVHIRLVEQAPGLLSPFAPPLRAYTRRQLLDRGVELRLGTTIREVAAGHILLADGEEVPSDLTVWAAGVAAPAAVGGWGLPQGPGGRVLVEPDLRVRGHQSVFAVGDIAVIDGQRLPQLAQPALQMGRHAADQIQRLAAGRDTLPFAYRDKGIMATIGRRSAVVQLPHGVRFRGTPAWLAWLVLHLVTLLGNRNRLSALVNLSWRYLSWRGGGGIIIGDGELEERDQPVHAM